MSFFIWYMLQQFSSSQLFSCDPNQCTIDMLGNGICDSECNNFDCFYDYMDCGCAPGCSSLYDPSTGWTLDANTNENCMVPACEYNYGSGFPDSFLVREHILTQIISSNWSLSVLFSHPDCDSSDLEYYDAGVACEKSDPCNDPLGMYCAGMVASSLQSCLRSDGNSCLVCEGIMIMHVCTSAVTQCPTGYQSQSEIVALFDGTSLTNLFCLRSPEVFTPYKYQEYYVSPSDPPESTGSGTIDDPFLSLYFAFTEVYATFTKIVLSTGDYFYQIDKQLTTPLIPNKYDPLNINSYLIFYELWIIGDPVSYSVVYWKDQLMISSKFYQTFIQNIVFKGDLILRNNCTGYLDYCYYCPTLYISDSSIITDQGVEITLDEYYNIPTNCSDYSDHTLFSFTSQAFFENVEFSGFRHQFNSLISSGASLNLTNVNFEAVQAKAGGSVITLLCPHNCEVANFGYITGLVSDLNYGYEHSLNVQVGSFFSSDKFGSNYFSGVSFTYNFLLSYLDSAYPAHLIGITDSIGAITILSCTFYANYVNSLIIIDQTNLLYEDLRPDALNVSQAYSQIHFTLANTQFSVIYSSIDFITYLMRRTVHNFYISSVSIQYVYSGDSGIINIANWGVQKSQETTGGQIAIMENQSETYISIPKRTVVVNNLYIDSCAAGSIVLNIATMPVVNIETLTISNVEDGTLSNVASVIQVFINSYRYLSQTPKANQISSMYCTGVTSITNIYSLYLDTLTIFQTSCQHHGGAAGLVVNTVTTASVINNILIYYISTTSRIGNAISISNLAAGLSITKISIYYVYNWDGSVVEFENVYSLDIKSIDFYVLVSQNFSPVTINQSVYVTIIYIYMTWVESWYGNGGSLYILACDCAYSYIMITEGGFWNGDAYYGRGGCVYLDCSTSSYVQWIYFENISFSGCYSLDGAAICISERVALMYNSSFVGLTISDSYSVKNGIISDYHYGGTLTISDLVMTRNGAVNAGILGQYPPPSKSYSNPGYPMLHLKKVSISGSKSSGPVLNFNSQDNSLFVQLDSVTIYDIITATGAYADAISLVKIGCVAAAVNITSMNQAFKASSSSYIIISQGVFTSLSGIFAELSNQVSFNCTNCDVTAVSNSLIIADNNCDILITNSSFSNIAGAFATLNNGVVFSCDLCSVSFVYDSLFSAQSNSNVTIYNSTFFRISGYFAKITTKVTFICNYCDVSYVEDSLVLANSDNSVTLNNSRFYNNNLLQSVNYLISITSGYPSYFINTTFTNNLSAFANFFYFSFTTIAIHQCVFSANSAADTGYSEIYAFTTVLSISNSIFSDQISSQDGAFLYILGNSSVSIDSTSFSNGYANNGGAIYIDSSLLTLNSCIFQENTGLVSGGSIYALSSPTTIFNTSFLSGSSPLGDAIYTSLEALNISTSHFSGSITTNSLPTSSVFIIRGTSITISNTSFTSPISKVSGLLVFGTSSVTISNCTFQDIRGVSYGAVGLVGLNANGSVSISQTRFIHNYSGGNGGGLSVQDMSLYMDQSVVDGNYAEADGGGIYMLIQTCEACSFSVTGLTKIINNACADEGGAIKWAGYKPNIEKTVFIDNNTAAYGGNFAGVACSIKPSRRHLDQSGDYLIFNAVPGQNFTRVLTISLYDTYGNILVTDNHSTLKLNTLTSYPDLTLRGTTSFTAVAGVFSLTAFTPGSPPGSTQQLLASTSAISNSGVPNDNSTYSNSAIIEIFFRNCTYGEQISSSACELCAEGTYLINPDFTCSTCPDGGICPGGYWVLPTPGHWRSSNVSTLVYSCPVPEACLGNSTAEDYIGTCSEGYYGIMCSSCSPGYTKSSTGYCSLCPSQALNIVILLFIIVVVLFFCIILIKTTIKSAFSHKELYSIYIKIFTNYLQLMFLTANFNFNWPSYVLQLFSVQQQAVKGTDTIFSVDCYLSSKQHGSSEDSYYYKFILIALLPVMIAIVSFIGWLGVCFTKEVYTYLKRELFLTIVILFFLVYPNISIMSFTHFACTDIDKMGSYLKVNYSIKCWDQRYTQYSLFVAIPSIVLWTIGLPTLILIIMIKKKKFLNRDNNRVIFGFFFNGYRKLRFYWEFIIIYRKITIIAICVFLSDVSLAVQALTIMMVMSVSSFVHYRLKPYSSPELNNMEMEALITSTITLYCGLYYLTHDIGSNFQIILFVLILIGNTYFVCYWLYWMTLAFFDILIQYVPRLRYFCRKGDAYEMEYFQEPISRFGSYYEETEGVRLCTFLNKAPVCEKGKEFRIRNMDDLYSRVIEEDYREIRKIRENRGRREFTLKPIQQKVKDEYSQYISNLGQLISKNNVRKEIKEKKLKKKRNLYRRKRTETVVHKKNQAVVNTGLLHVEEMLFVRNPEYSVCCESAYEGSVYGESIYDESVYDESKSCRISDNEVVDDQEDVRWY